MYLPLCDEEGSRQECTRSVSFPLRTLDSRRATDVDVWWVPSRVTLFLLVLLHRHAGDAPLLKLGRGYKTRGTSRVVLSRLPPVMVVLADDLQDIAGLEGDPGLRARYQLVLQWIIVELCTNENLSVQRKWR